MRTLNLLRLSATALALFTLAACEDFPQQVAQTVGKLPAVLPAPVDRGYWHGDEATGRAKIVVNVSEQRAFFYKGKKLVGESTVSTGKKGFDTPPGTYTVLQKDKDHASSEFGDYVNDEGEVVKSNVDARKDKRPAGAEFRGAKMPYFMRFRGGYGMHAGYVPSFRASHGCIRLPMESAKHFFEGATEGTAVIVKE
ncbi:MAG: L,D-transpeptidase family protein [Verrucomicrobiota bacterium]|nr:L,D-transpeptidase family protein [Verrucomicrobiota bacterium]